MSESNVIYHAFQEIAETEKSYQHHLRGNGGGGTFDGMETRVAKLESDVEHIKNDIAEIKVDIRDMRKQIEGNFKWLLSVMGGICLALAWCYG